MHTDGTDGQTGMTKLKAAFRNFAKAPKEGNDVSILHMKYLVITKTTNLFKF